MVSKKNLGLDNDVALYIEQRAAKTGLSQAQVVNEAIRLSQEREARMMGVIKTIVEAATLHLWQTVREELNGVISDQNECIRIVLKEELAALVPEMAGLNNKNCERFRNGTNKD